MPFDPRFLTGPAMMLMGAVLLVFAVRMWRVHPVNRVLRLGPYVTEAGMIALLNMRMTLLSYATFLLVYGLASVVFWYARREVNDPLVQFLGSLGTGLGLWAAGNSLVAFWRVYRR